VLLALLQLQLLSPFIVFCGWHHYFFLLMLLIPLPIPIEGFLSKISHQFAIPFVVGCHILHVHSSYNLECIQKSRHHSPLPPADVPSLLWCLFCQFHYLLFAFCCCTILHRIALHCVLLHCAALHYTSWHGVYYCIPLLWNTVLCCTACTALHYIAFTWYCMVHCTSLH